MQVSKILFSTILAASAVLAAPAPGEPQRMMVFPCPEESGYGTCNSCTFLPNGTLASVTRKVCGEYTESTCRSLFGGSFLCDDNCNRCLCTEAGLASTKMLCPPYKFENCVAGQGTEPWDCGNRKCVCNKYGIASYFA